MFNEVKYIVAIFVNKVIGNETVVLKKKWQKIYLKFFKKRVDFSNLEIPIGYNSKNHFGIIVAKGQTMNEAIAAMEKKIMVSLPSEDLDANIISDRITDKDYFIMFDKNVEFYGSLRMMSANEFAEMGGRGITLLERLLLGIYYFNETKRYLDVDNFDHLTMCFSSRWLNGKTPSVMYCPGHRWQHSNLSHSFYPPIILLAPVPTPTERCILVL